MPATRVASFVIALLLLTEAVGPAWGWFAALLVFALFSLFTLTGLAQLVVAFLLLLGIADESRAWYIVLVVLSSLALLRSTPVLDRRRHWQLRVDI